MKLSHKLLGVLSVFFFLLTASTEASHVYLEDYIAQYNPKEARQISHHILNYSRQYKVNPAWVTGMFLQESKFNNKAVSRSGARGIAQLMPATARELQVNPKKVNENIHGGIKYFRQMLDLNNGNLKLALASYNAGYGTVKKHKGIPPRKQTQDYVRIITKNIKDIEKQKVIFKNKK